MATKKSNQPQGPKEPTILTLPRTEAKEKIQARIDLGNDLKISPANTEEEYLQKKARYLKWNSFNTELLKRLFSDESEYKSYAFWGIVGLSTSHWTVEAKELVSDIEYGISKLESLYEKLDLFPEPRTNTSLDYSSLPVIPESKTASNKIFIVHGRDPAAESQVARLLESFGLVPVILHEQTDQGLTIIEKFEKHAKEVSFAVILMTPDDKGGLKDEDADKLKFRARQNVVFEHGFFVASLGRGKVSAIYKKGVEIYSDISGILFTEMDEAGYWRLKLGRELQDAGFSVDLNKVR